MDLKYKFAKTKEKVLIFPFPVEKGKKYLITPDRQLTTRGLEILMSALNFDLIHSPLLDPASYSALGLHDDGQTPAFQLKIAELSFHFLKEKKIDPVKAQTIEQILSKKLREIILAETLEHHLAAYQNFKQRFASQLKCSTCQEMGINSPELNEWVESLIP